MELFGKTPRPELAAVNLDDDKSADLAIVGGNHVNVHAGEIVEEDIAIYGDRIVATGDIDHVMGEETEIIDASGKYVTPGLVDGHTHSYHVYINGTVWAKNLLRHGVTTASDGFYGQAIVGGVDAVRFCMDEINDTHLKLVALAPSIGQAHNTRVPVPKATEGVTIDDLSEILSWDDVYGLGEVPQTCLDSGEGWLELFEESLELGKVVYGHNSQISEARNNAFAAAGGTADHEIVDPESGIGDVRKGIFWHSRQGVNIDDIRNAPTPSVAKAWTEMGLSTRHVGVCTDVVEPDGSKALDENVRLLIQNGTNPIEAIQMATINNCEGMRVANELGSVTPGKVADVLIVDDLTDFTIEKVIASGELVAEDSELLVEYEQPEYPTWMTNTVNIGDPVEPAEFAVTVDDGATKAEVTTIEIEDGILLTEEGAAILDVADGEVQVDVERDILKIAMVDRHNGSGRIGVGFLDGFGLKEGAFASSVNCSRENIAIVGTNDEDIARAVNRIDELQGGFVVTKDGQVTAEVPLPLLGLQSDGTTDDILEQFSALLGAIEEQGSTLSGPLMSLEFSCCCVEMPSVRISEYGLVDLEKEVEVDLIRSVS